MAVACSILFLFRPILLELGSAIRIDGASVSRLAERPGYPFLMDVFLKYMYLLNLTTKSWALCAAAMTLIDA
jgi:hypothetical protein